MKVSRSAVDVTKPGDERARSEGLKAVDGLGSMPIIYTPWLNKGAPPGLAGQFAGSGFWRAAPRPALPAPGCRAGENFEALPIVRAQSGARCRNCLAME